MVALLRGRARLGALTLAYPDERDKIKRWRKGLPAMPSPLSLDAHNNIITTSGPVIINIPGAVDEPQRSKHPTQPSPVLVND